MSCGINFADVIEGPVSWLQNNDTVPQNFEDKILYIDSHYLATLFRGSTIQHKDDI